MVASRRTLGKTARHPSACLHAAPSPAERSSLCHRRDSRLDSLTTLDSAQFDAIAGIGTREGKLTNDYAEPNVYVNVMGFFFNGREKEKWEKENGKRKSGKRKSGKRKVGKGKWEKEKWKKEKVGIMKGL